MRVSQLACINRQNPAKTGPPRAGKDSWQKRCDRPPIFQRRSSLHNYHLVCRSVAFVEQRFGNIYLRHHQQRDGEEEVSGDKSSCPQIERQIQPEQSLIVRGLRRLLPVATHSEGPQFFLRRNGRLYATPILLVLAFIEATDILFAVDSVPAIFAITREPLVVYTSNVFAILGLRTMYFLLAGALARFHLLRYGLALILICVGLKMSWLNAAWQGHFPSTISLGVIVGVLTASIGLSLVFPASRTPKAAG